MAPEEISDSSALSVPSLALPFVFQTNVSQNWVCVSCFFLSGGKHVKAYNKFNKDQVRNILGIQSHQLCSLSLLLSSLLLCDTGDLLLMMSFLVGGCQVLRDSWKLVKNHTPSISPCCVPLRCLPTPGEPTHLHTWRTAALPHLSPFSVFIIPPSLFSLFVFLISSFMPGLHSGLISHKQVYCKHQGFLQEFMGKQLINSLIL